MKDSDIRQTGGQIDDLVISLVEAAHDKEAKVRNLVEASLVNIGGKQPIIVLTSCSSYLASHPKLVQGHRIILLNVIEKVLKEAINSIEEDVAVGIVKQAFTELTFSKEAITEWQSAAGNVIVALCGKFCHEVMSELLDRFQPGVLPHYYLVQTLADLALANVFGMVPYLKACLNTCLSMMSLVKADNLKCAFAKMLANFSEAIVDYMANIDNAPDQNMSKEFFYEEMSTAWDLLFNLWLNSKDTKVRCSVVECLGRMSHILPPKMLWDCLPKLLSAFYSLYKKQLEVNIISEGLSHILDVSTTEDSLLLEPHVDSLLVVLFQQSCHPISFSSSFSIKNHNEVLRCFSILAKSYPERVVSFILNKLESVNEKSRIGCLNIIQHLVNYAGDNFRDKEMSILSGLKMITADPNNKVKRMLAQAIIKIAHHGYLELEGGQVLIEFIIKQCVLTSDHTTNNPGIKSDPDLVTNGMLKSFCENVLNLLSTTLLNTTGTLWPYLMTFLISESYIDAIGVLCKAISTVASRKLQNDDPDYYVDFEREVNIPKPPAIFARLIVSLGCPNKKFGGACHIINALISLSQLIRPSFAQLWKSNLENVLSILNKDDSKEIEFLDGVWEEKVLKLLSKCMEEVDNDDWPTLCGEEFIKQISLYSHYPHERNFSHKCIGMTMSKSSNDEFVTKSMDVLFNGTRHIVEDDREACAQAVGLAASTHIDLVLKRLNSIHKSKKTSFIVTFFKEAIGDLDEKIKATIFLSYGYVALRAPVNFLQTRIDADIASVVNQNIYQVKDPTIRYSMVKTIQLIGISLSTNPNLTNASLSSRNSLLNHLKNLLKHESQTIFVSEMRSLVIGACSALTKMGPVLTPSEAQDIFSLMVSRVICLPSDSYPSKCSDSNTSTTDAQQLQYNELNSCLEAFRNFSTDLVNNNTTPEMFIMIFEVLHPFVTSTQPYHKIRSIQLLSDVAEVFYKKVNVALVNQMTNLGQIIGIMVPRCSDELVSVRLLALGCIVRLLKIGLRYEGRSPDFQGEFTSKINDLNESIDKMDSVTMFGIISELSKILNQKIGINHLLPYTEGLLEGLTDVQSLASSAACLALSNCIKTRGSEFHGMVEKVFFALVLKLPEIKNPQTLTGSLRALRFLTQHHLLKVTSLLLEEPVPFSWLVREIWKDLGHDLHTMTSILDHLLEMLSRSQPYEEISDNKGKDKLRKALIPPLAIVCAITELLKSEACHTTVLNNYPQLLSQLLVQVASMTSARIPKSTRKIQKNSWSKSKVVASTNISPTPVGFAVEGLKQVLVSCKNQNLLDHLDMGKVWELFTLDQQDGLLEGLTTFSRCLVQCQTDMLPKIINHLSPIFSSIYSPQRMMVAAVFAEFVNRRCGDDLCTVDILINCVVGRLTDTDPTVRRLCIRGLGNIASCGPKMVQKYCSILLPALMGGLDDKDDVNDVITLEAMEGLSKVLCKLVEADVRNILIKVALRIRPCFGKARAEVRTASLTLFGDLAAFGSGECKEAFLEQIHSNLVTILLYLNDSDPFVRQASQLCLKKIGPLLGSGNMDEMFQNLDNVPNYLAFLNDLSEVIVNDLSEKLNYLIVCNLTYFKSSSPQIRGNAATFAGCLLGNLPSDKASSESKEQSCKALMSLLKDDEVTVRAMAVEAIGLLYNI